MLDRHAELRPGARAAPRARRDPLRSWRGRGSRPAGTTRRRAPRRTRSTPARAAPRQRTRTAAARRPSPSPSSLTRSPRALRAPRRARRAARGGTRCRLLRNRNRRRRFEPLLELPLLFLGQLAQRPAHVGADRHAALREHELRGGLERKAFERGSHRREIGASRLPSLPRRRAPETSRQAPRPRRRRRPRAPAGGAPPGRRKCRDPRSDTERTVPTACRRLSARGNSAPNHAVAATPRGGPDSRFSRRTRTHRTALARRPAPQQRNARAALRRRAGSTAAPSRRHRPPRCPQREPRARRCPRSTAHRSGPPRAGVPFAASLKSCAARMRCSTGRENPRRLSRGRASRRPHPPPGSPRTDGIASSSKASPASRRGVSAAASAPRSCKPLAPARHPVRLRNFSCSRRPLALD